MSRIRLAAAAAVAVVGGVLWWLLGTGPGAPRAERESRPGRGAAVPAPRAEGEFPGPAESTAPGTPAGAPVPVAAAPDEESAGQGESPKPVDMVHCTTVLEDGTPLPGVWLTERNLFGPDLPKVTTGPSGEVDLPVYGGLVKVWHPWVDLVAAAGGTVVPTEDGIRAQVRPESDGLRLVFRDRPGTAHVRLVDASTGTPVTDTSGLRMSWEFRGGLLAIGQPEDPGLGGWIPVLEGRLPEAGGVDPATIRVDPEKVTLVLALPGYEPARLPLPEVRGRREVRVNPMEPDARGVVVAPTGPEATTGEPKQVAVYSLTAHLRSTDAVPKPVPPDLLGLPWKEGPFALYGLPDGSWEIEVLAEVGDPDIWKISGGPVQGRVVRGKKSFEKRGATAEIGNIELKEGGTVRLEVVDAAGKAMPQAFVVVVRTEEDPDQGRPFFPNAVGSVVVADLEPGADHRVQVRGLPRFLEQTVRAVPASEAKDVEFRWPEKAVPCRITLVVDGRVVANPDGSRTIPASVHDSPLPRDRGSWGADGTFEASLVPGTYRFSAYATPKEGTGLALFAGEVTVPAGESFETRLELRREP